jgi:serine/threonine protein kinase
LLSFDPIERLTAEDALNHPYLAPYHYPEDEPDHPRQFDFSFEVIKSIDEVKSNILIKMNLKS